MPPRCQLLSAGLYNPQVFTRHLQSTPRTFTTSSTLYKNPLQRRRGGDLGAHLPKHVIPTSAEIPEYPYDENLLYRQSNKGLYGGQMIQFGNNVSKKTETKTRRHWKPNVLSKSMYSVALKKRIKLRITHKVLRIIDREGGLDEYLLKQNEHRVKELGPTGWALRWTLMQTPVVQARMRAEAAALGLDQEIIDQQWPSLKQFGAQKPEAKSMEEAITTQDESEDLKPQEELEVNWIEVADEVGPDESLEPLSSAEQAQEVKKLVDTKTKAAMAEANVEYKRATSAAKRYLLRGVVDNEIDGLKLAFVRAKEREIKRLRNRADFKQRLADQFPHLKPKDRKGAYAEWKSQGIKEAGSYELWRRSLVKPETEAAYAATIAEAGGVEALAASKRAAAAKEIQDAENAHRNTTLPESQRLYLVEALKKANRAARANAASGKGSYIKWTVEELQAQKPSILKTTENQGAKKVDEWAGLAEGSQTSTEPRINA